MKKNFRTHLEADSVELYDWQGVRVPAKAVVSWGWNPSADKTGVLSMAIELSGVFIAVQSGGESNTNYNVELGTLSVDYYLDQEVSSDGNIPIKPSYIIISHKNKTVHVAL